MKVAILSDIHGNKYALKVVLQEIDNLKITKILNLGDLIGYYNYSSDIISMLRKYDMISVRGNHEEILKQYLIGTKIYKSNIDQKYGLGHRTTTKTLSSTELKQLVSQPLKQSIILGNLRITLSHGAPEGSFTYVYPDADRSLLKTLDVPNTDFLFMGHTHYPMTFKGDHTHIINVGSIGQSRVIGGIANWGILNTANGVYCARSTPYCTKKLIKELESNRETPDYLIDILKRRRDGEEN